MQTDSLSPRIICADTLKFEIYPSREEAANAAATAAAAEIQHQTRQAQDVAVIFATGASQLSMLKALTSLPNVSWERVIGFHMDEYRGMDANHFASFRRYMREELCQRVPLKEFHEINGDSLNPEAVCQDYENRLKRACPRLCLLGIGENGHLAFNDPGVADFHDSQDVKIVALDQECREQQVAEGWFPSVEAVPEHAITLTIPALFRVPKLIVSVPSARKAKIVRRVIDEPISTACPASLLKTHPDATVYLDEDSAAELNDLTQ
jgi:glucosamine-6-phosphate deaminase